MRRALTIGFAIFASILTLAVALVFVLTNTDWGREKVRTRVVSALAGAVHGQLSIGRLSGNLLNGISIDSLVIADSTGAPFISASAVHVGYSLRPFLSSKIELNDVRLDNPVIVLDRALDGRWNFDRIFPSDSTAVKTDTAGIQFGDWIVLHDLRIANGDLTVRMPLGIDSSFSATQRDSAIAVATSESSRTVVVKVAGGYQQVQQFHDLDAKIPLARIAHPDYSTRLFEIDSLSTIALAFAPPSADIRQLAGTFELNTDSVWFRVPQLELPSSSATLAGRYTIENGDLSLRVEGKPVALSDVRFLYPALPEEGSASMNLAMDWTGGVQRYLVRNLDLRTGTAVAQGNIGITLGDTLLLNETAVTFSGIDTRLVEKLIPTLEIPREGVLAGSAKLDGPLTAMRLDGDVTFDDTRSGKSRVIAAGTIGTADGVVQAGNLRVRLAPMQVDLVRIASPDFPLGGVLTGSAVINGASDSRITARGIDLTHLDRGERIHVTGNGAVTMGDTPLLNVDLMAQPLSLVTVGRFAPAAGLRGSVTGPIRVNGSLADLAINSTLSTSDGGAISATGKLDLKSAELGYNMQVATVLFNANTLVEKAPVTSLSAEFAARGRGVDPATMMADLNANVSTSTFDTLAVDSSRIAVRIANGIATIDTFAVRVPGAAADVLGTFGLAEGLAGSIRYSVMVDSLGKFARYLPIDTGFVAPRPARSAERLAIARADSIAEARRLMVARAAGVEPPAVPIRVDTVTGFPRDSLAGSIKLNGTLTGNLKAFDTKGSASAAGIVAMGNAVQRARVNYEWLGALTPHSAMSLKLNADSIMAAGFSLDSVETSATYLKPGGTAQVSVFQNSDRDYMLRANYAVFPDRKELLFDNLRFRFDSTVWASARPGGVKWGEAGYEIDALEIRNPTTGRVYLNGRIPTEGVADLELVVKDFQMHDLLGLLQSDVDARGLLSINGTVKGTAASPTIEGSVMVDSARYAGTVVPDIRTTFDYADQRLDAQADATYIGQRIIEATGRIPVNLAISGVEGSRLPDEAAQVDIKADSVPLDLASRFTDAVSQIKGFAKGDVQVRGTIKKPELTGDIFLSLGEARLNSTGVLFRDITGAMKLRGDTIVLDSLTANSNGRIRLTGGFGIAKIAEPSFDLKLTSANARILDNEQGKVRADADITVKGPFDGVVVSGRARIREGVLYIPESDNTQVLSAGDPAVFAVIDTSSQVGRELVGSSPLLDNLRMDLRLSVDRDTWVRSKDANVEVYSDGDLRINIDRKSQSLTLEGVANTDRGVYEFLSKRFQIKRGTVTFTGTQDIDPLLQLTGEYEIKQASRPALAIKILIGGTLLSPRLTLESDAQPPISQSDLLSYLAFGSETGSLLQFGGGSSISGGTAGGGLVGTSAALATKQLTSVGLGILVDQVEGQAARSLGADEFRITPADLPTEVASGNFGALETFLKGTQFDFGKYFSTNTFVSLQAQLSVAPGFRVEHRFRGSPGLSIESTFQPRFFLPEPSLSTQDLKKSNALGIFLVRRWRF